MPRQSLSQGRWRLCFKLVAVCLLLCSTQTAAEISATFSTATAVNTFRWTLADVTQGGAGGAVSVARGDQIILPFATRVTYALGTSIGTVQGTISVTLGGTCSPTGNVTNLTGLEIIVGSAPAVPIAGPGDCSSSGRCANLAFGPITVPSARLPAPGITSMTVKALWDGAEAPGCPAATIPISWVTTTTKPGTVTLSQTPTWPSWNTFFVGNWLNTAPTMVVSSSGNVPATAPATTTLSAVDATGEFVYSWTWTISNILFCLPATTVGMSVTLTTDDTSQTKTAPTTITVTGCDLPVTVDLTDVRTQTALTFAWTQNIVPQSSSSISVPWGGGGTIPARGTFTRTVTSAQFSLTMTIQLTNPTRGPLAINNLQLMCLWGPTLTLPCGGFNAQGVQGGAGSGLVIPASQTLSCPLNNFPIPGTWGVDFTQPCRIVATTFFGRTTEFNQFTLNFAAPTVWTRINDCATWSVTCSPATGNAFWQPIVSGGPSGTRICGSDTNRQIPDQTFDVSLSGGWNGAGDQPGACASPVTSTCNSQIDLQSTGAVANTGGGQSSSFTVTAVPINCPNPPPSPSPPPVPSPSLPSGQLLSNNGISASIRVTGTTVGGAFGWTTESSADPPAQSIALGSTGNATYRVRAVRGNADDASPVKYIISGEITVTNSNTRQVGIATVSAALDTAQVPATCPVTLPAQMDPGASMVCQFRVQYNRASAPGLLDAVVALTDTAVRVSANEQAAFDFSQADVSGASNACAFVSMTFAANAGMALQKLSDVGSPVLRVDGEPVRVCDTTEFRFGVEYAPTQPLPCGLQPVVSTASVVPDNTDRSPVRQSVTTVNITATGCPDFAAAPATGGPPAAAPTVGPTASTGSPSGVTVTMGQVATGAVDNAAWSLRVVPSGSADEAVTKARDDELPDGLKFRLVYSKTIEKMTKYSGDLTITNGGDTPMTVDSITVELVDSLSPVRAVVSQINVACPREVSSSSPLTIPAQGKQTCSYAITAKTGGELAATVSVVEMGDSVQSAPEVVKQFLADAEGPSCATLVSGLGVSSLLEGGKVVAGDKIDESEVCDSGSKEVVFAVGKTPKAACATYQFLTLARIVPDVKSTASPVTASAAVDVVITGCPAAETSPDTVSISKLNSFKMRMIKWSVNKTATPVAAGGTLTYVPSGANAVAVSVLYSRQYAGGLTMSINGVLDVPVKGTPPAGSNNKVLIFPLCASSETCGATEADTTCGSTVRNDSITCRFNKHKMPVVSGTVLAMVFSTADQQSPNPAKVFVYDPNTATGRRTMGRCAVLTDEQQIAPPAKVTRSDEVNPPPTQAVCAASWLYTYTLKFSDVACDGSTKDFTSQGTATPVDTAVATATGSLKFGVNC